MSTVVHDVHCIQFLHTVAKNFCKLNINVILQDGERAESMFWQVAGYVNVGVGAAMKGIQLVKTDVTFRTGSSLNGRILAQTACVLQIVTISQA
jgi:hypothetical protein